MPYSYLCPEFCKTKYAGEKITRWLKSGKLKCGKCDMVYDKDYLKVLSIEESRTYGFCPCCGTKLRYKFNKSFVGY